MAENILGRNFEFPIKNADGTSFHNLVLHKATYDSVIMSLGDKITGDVYYKDNALSVTMQEYIEYKRNPNADYEDAVKFVLVNPPTIVREGMAKDNGDLKGMTKYSFEFYHPMYMLANFPFTDVAVTESEELYLAQNKTFSWIGNAIDYVAKLNANLQNTQWEVRISDSLYDNGVASQKLTTLSEVLTFDNNSIADALKTFYDTYDIPFVIDLVRTNEPSYELQGKRFFILVGLPSNEIIGTNQQPYIFRMGQGVGLKNNSRTPKNNKIITRIAGHGSENNIPYGYPQIIWQGDQNAKFTIGNSAGVKTNVTINGHTYAKAVSYPIYDGIVGGQYVKLIKHPFTRTTLMPSVYVASVNRKVNPYAEDYDCEAQIIDYYDAISDQDFRYPNEIVANAPSFEMHAFDDIKPELGEVELAADCIPLASDKVDYKNYERISKSDFESRMDELAASFRPEQVMGLILADMMDAYTYQRNEADSNTGGSHTWSWIVDFNGGYCYVSFSSDIIAFKYAVLYNPAIIPADNSWDDTMDDDGKYLQSYFKMTLPRLSFDLYACASITEKMDINMRSGECMGCTFPVQVDWEDYKKNFYDSEGNFAPNGAQRDLTKYPNSAQGSITVIVQKDNNTFGTLLPNVYQQPKGPDPQQQRRGDRFVILGISLPQSYVDNAQERLDNAMKQYMLDNNVYYYDYPLKFDEYFLATNTNILAQIHPNTLVRFRFANTNNVLYVKQMTIKYGEAVLPQYDITLTDDVEVVLNKIGQVTEDVSRVRVGLNELQKYYGEDAYNEINAKLSRTVDDVAQGRITFQQGLESVGSAIFGDEIRSREFINGLYAGKGWRIDELGNAELESLRVRSFLEIVEMLINRQQAQEGDTSFTDNDQIEHVEEIHYRGNTYYKLTLKEKWDGYITAQQVGNILRGIVNTLAANAGNVSDVDERDCPEQDGDNKYYTSWMKMVKPELAGTSTEENQIVIILYNDLDTPAGKNFPPCELMNIVRWGCDLDPDDPNDAPTEADRQSIIRRQQSFYISASEGRIVKLRGVRTPILQNGNYGTTLGILPDFVKNTPTIAERLIEGRDYLYAQGVVVGDFIKIDAQGLPLTNYVDKGEWQSDVTYLHNAFDADDLQWETHDVWHNGAYWRCEMTNQGHEPVENSVYWHKLMEGVEGEHGINTATVFIYKRGQIVATSDRPNTTATYTFATATLTFDDTTSANGWSTSVPTTTNDMWPCWVREVVVASPSDSVSIARTQWGIPYRIDTIEYQVNARPNSIVLHEGDVNRAITITAAFYKFLGGTRAYYTACYWALFRVDNSGTAFTRITSGQTSSSGYTMTYSSERLSYDDTYSQYVIRINSSSMASATATSAYLAQATIDIIHEGQSGEDVVAYEIRSNVDSVKIPSDVTSLTTPISGSFYRHIGAETDDASLYYVVTYRTSSGYVRDTTIMPQWITSQAVTSFTLSSVNANANIEAIAIFAYTSNTGITTSNYSSPDIYVAKYEIPIIKDGDTGERGQMGRNYYYAGVYDANAQYTVTAAEAPFVSIVVDGQTRYYVRIGEDDTTTQGVNPVGDTTGNWTIMTSDFKYLITEAMFTNFAKLGSGVFNQDWMFSQYGADRVTLWSGSHTRAVQHYIQVGLSDSSSIDDYDDTLNHFSVEAGKKYVVYVTARATSGNLFLKVNYHIEKEAGHANTQGLTFTSTASTTTQVYAIEFYAEYTCEAFVASYGYGVVTKIETEGAVDYQKMSPTFPNLDDVTFDARVLVNDSYTSLNNSLEYGAPIFLIAGKQYTISYKGRSNTSGSVIRLYLCLDGTNTQVAGDWAELPYSSTDVTRSKTYTSNTTGYARIRAYNTTSGQGGYVNGATIHAISPFVPTVAIDWRTGYAHFGGDSIRFNPDGSGKVASGNINWNAQGDLNVKGKIEATSLGRSMAYYQYGLSTTSYTPLLTILSTNNGLQFASLWVVGDGLPSKIVLDNTGSTGGSVTLPPASDFVGQEIEIFNADASSTFILRAGSSSSGSLINFFGMSETPTIRPSGRIRILAVEDINSGYAWMILDSDNTSLTS